MPNLCVCGRCTGDILHAPHCGHFIENDGRCSCGGTVEWLFKQRDETAWTGGRLFPDVKGE